MSIAYRKPQGSADLKSFALILCQCFNTPPSQDSAYLNRLGPDYVRLICEGDRIVGGLGMVPLGQWYWGARIPMVGIAAVGIAPEYRGQGTAFALLQGALQELHEQNTPLSMLYSAAQPLYRKLGYEQSGTLCLWQVATEAIRMRDYTLPMQPIAISDIQSEFADLYQQQAQTTNGFVDRSSLLWQMLQDPQNGMLPHAYRIGSEGYVIFRHQSNGGQQEILIRDWVLRTPAALRRFWTFLADHRSQVDTVLWRSSSVDALSLALPEQAAKLRSSDRWMLRIVCAPAALKLRPYPGEVNAELHFAIEDALLPGNSGDWILRVANGKGEVMAGGRGELQLTINALAPLYSGLFTARQLQLWGKLAGTTDAIATAERLFAGSVPWMPDFF